MAPPTASSRGGVVARQPISRQVWKFWAETIREFLERLKLGNWLVRQAVKTQEILIDPPINELGPAMLALNEKQRRFVIGVIASGGKNAAHVARLAGYGNKNGCAKVRAHYLMHDPKIEKALQEEAGRTLNGMTAFAVARLHRNLNSRNEKVAQVAIDSILDRTGFPRRTERSLDVTDVRQQHNHEQLLTMVSERLRVLISQEPKLIENAQYTEMEDVAHADGDAGVQDEQSRDSSKVNAPPAMETKRGGKRGR